MHVYPSWRYHEVKEPVIVKCAEEEKALGPGWKDSPAAFEKKEEIEKPCEEAGHNHEAQAPKRRGRPAKVHA